MMSTLYSHSSGLATVDVRDVAAAHTLGLFTPSAKGRYICSAQTVKLSDMAKVIADFYPTRYGVLEVWSEISVDPDRHGLISSPRVISELINHVGPDPPLPPRFPLI